MRYVLACPNGHVANFPWACGAYSGDGADKGCRHNGSLRLDVDATVSSNLGALIYTWKKRFGSFQSDDMRRLKQLEQENLWLKKLVAERDLEIEVMKEIAAKIVGVPARRE